MRAVNRCRRMPRVVGYEPPLAGDEEEGSSGSTNISETRPASPEPAGTTGGIAEESPTPGPGSVPTEPAARKSWYDEVPAEDAGGLRQSFAEFQHVLATSVSHREDEPRTSAVPVGTGEASEPLLSTSMKVPPEGGPDSLPREQQDAFNLRKMGLLQRTQIRIPALAVTLLVELVVAFVISRYADSGIFRKYPLLIAFQPVISAISGNVGLQSASINVRELAVGLTSGSGSVLSGIKTETKTGALLGLAMGVALGGIATVWYAPIIPNNDSHTWSGAVVFGFAICVGQFISAWCAASSGAAAPLIFTKCGLDPTTVAGPMETAIQDVLGSSLLLALSAALLEAFGDAGAGCPGGDLSGCVSGCKEHVNTSSLMIDGEFLSCLDNCVQLNEDGIC